ncbi:MAG: LysM peptidoglycan-binding domain-containing protein [Anaerolineae bacterium]|nr:LysM peptidoglycan-binding domain-containing protein [Anaerolineae bacterium]
MLRGHALLLFLVFALLLAGCNFAPSPQGDVSPTVETIALTQPALLPSPSPSSSPTSMQVTPEPQVETATATFTPGPPTALPTSTPTPGPYEHTMKQGETLGYIIQLYGYRDFGVIDEVVRLNDNIPNADTLPGEGAVILIPRQTVTPTPEDFTPLPDVAQVLGVGVAPTSPATGLNIDAPIIKHTVVEGQTVVDIAVNYNTTLEVLAVLNPDISFAGCNFEVQSGGPNCNPLLRVGQDVMVPAATPTPTLSPTPSGSETPTPTPTHAAPVVILPPQDANVQPGVFRLEWVGVGVLQADEVYLVQITDTTTGDVFNDITRTTSLLLPDSMIPTDGQPHVLNWTVAVARPNDSGVYRVMSGSPEVRRFNWLSR